MDDQIKVIFLDVDGVLNNREHLIAAIEKDPGVRKLATEIFNLDCVNNLKKIIETTGAKIVVSSTWRLGNMFATLLWRFKEWGIAEHFMSVTPYLPGKQRGDEIREWLKDWPNVKQFVIIDDDRDMCEYTDTYLAKTDYDYGLTADIAEKAIQILNMEVSNEKCADNHDRETC